MTARLPLLILAVNGRQLQKTNRPAACYGHAAVEAYHLKGEGRVPWKVAALSNVAMNGNSIDGLVSEVKEKTQSVAFAISSPSFDSALTASSARGITAGFRPDFERRELPTEAGKEVGQGGFVWISNNVLSVVERLPKKCRPSVRSVLLAYAQLSSRRGNARTFPAAAELVARLAGCSVRTVHNADKQLVAIGLVTIRRQKVQGRDTPRLVTLSEVSAAPPVPFEVVDVDELPAVRAHRRQQSKRSVHTGMQVVQCNLHTLKKLPKEKNRVSLSKDNEPCCEGMEEREGVGDSRNEAMARKHGLTVAEVEKHRRQHESDMAAGRRAGRVKGFANEASLDRYIASLPSKAKSAPTTDKTTDKVTEAVALRARWWKQFAATTANVPSSWNGADDDTRKDFAISNEGRTFATLACSLGWDGAYFKVDEETGEIIATSSTGDSRLHAAGNKWKL